MAISEDLKTAYDNFYAGRDEEWRMLSARYKASNIRQVCRGRSFTKILEVGAGDGSILHFLDQWNFAPEIHALEISESGVDHIRNRKLSSLKSVSVFDGYHIPFSDGEFDLVILSHVLEHVEFERTLLRELARVGKSVVIEVPKDYRYGVDQRVKHFLAYGHINMYTPTSLRYLLRTEGFRIISDKNSMISPEVTKFNVFVNQKKTRSVFLSLKIDLEYTIKKILIALGGKRRLEGMANAYTVLVEKETGGQGLAAHITA